MRNERASFPRRTDRRAERQPQTLLLRRPRGIADLPHPAVAEIVRTVQEFDDFSEDNDPYGEHDFGAFTHAIAGKIFWKIDYYDSAYEMGSEDPTDETKTGRLLTILLAEEY